MNGNVTVLLVTIVIAITIIILLLISRKKCNTVVKKIDLSKLYNKFDVCNLVIYSDGRHELEIYDDDYDDGPFMC